MAAAQYFQTQKIENNQNIIQIQLGPCRTIRNHFNLIHVVNLTEYENNLDKISQVLDKFEMHTSLENPLRLSKRKFTDLKKNLLSLLPTKRHRRGLVNGLGSTIKFITGNMDAADAERINKELSRLHSEQSVTRNIIDQEHTINNQMIQRLKNITNYINLEQNYINSYLEKLSNTIREENNMIKEIQHINQINYNIDMLNNHLKDISQTLILAKLNIISNVILNKEEIESIHKMLTNEQIELISEEHMYNLLNLQAYYNNSNIIFNVKIPQIENNNCNFYNIIPLPINNTKQIVTKPYVAYNNKTIQFFDKVCQKVEHIYYCQRAINEIATENSTCIGAIFNNRTPSCHLNEMELTTTIYQPRANLILLYNVPQTLIKFNCSKPNEMTVEGTMMITFQACIVEINGVIYTDSFEVFWDEVQLILPSVFSIQPKSVSSPVTLPKLQEFDFRHNSSIVAIEYENNIRAISTISAITILTIITTIAIILAVRRKTIISYSPESTHTVAPTISLWPSLYSRGGGVTYVDTTPQLTPAKPPRATVH